MWRLLVFTGLLLTRGQCSDVESSIADTETAASSSDKAVLFIKDEESQPVKRSPISAYGQEQQGQYLVRQSQEPQELAPEYLALLQQYLEAQQQHQHQQHQQQPQHQPQRARLGGYIDQELRAAPLQHRQQQQVIPLEVEQYHVETSPRRPIQQQLQQQLYYPVEEQPQVPIQHVQPAAAAPPPPPPPPQRSQHVQQLEPQPQQQFRYHQSIPVQYGYEDEEQIHQQQLNPESIVRAQAQAEAQALAFQKISQASHYKHQNSALEQIRVANENHRKQSALEQIRQGEAVSEAGRQERIEQISPKDPEAAYKARLKAQATALVAEQRRAQEASEYRAHAEAILKHQAQQQKHIRDQEEAHKYALNFEKNQQRAQAHAQAIATAQAIALYNARKQANEKAQNEAKQAARAQAEARRENPDSAPVVQYLLPNKVALPAPEVYLPKAEEALRAAVAQAKRLKKPQSLKHLLLQDLDPQLFRRPKLEPEPQQPQQQQQLAFLVDAGYYRKQQQQQRPLLKQNEYQGLEEVGPAPRQHYQQYHQQIDADKLALLVPIDHQSP